MIENEHCTCTESEWNMCDYCAEQLMLNLAAWSVDFDEIPDVDYDAE
jgi:hypothetical protein